MKNSTERILRKMPKLTDCQSTAVSYGLVLVLQGSLKNVANFFEGKCVFIKTVFSSIP